MREIPNKVKNLIINILNCSITDAIYIFGSYGTEYFEEGESDIDIAWFTNKKLDLTMKLKFQDLLSEILKIDVDLVVVNGDSSFLLLREILEGECILVGTDAFVDWFDDFYDKNMNDIDFLDKYMDGGYYV